MEKKGIYRRPSSRGLYAGLGQKDEAFRALEEAFHFRSRYLVWLKVAPEYEQLRPDPRYRELVARIGLP